MLASARDRTDGRRDRLSEATPSVPTPLWVGLVLAGCIAVLIQLVMADPREHMLVQGGMIGGVAAIVSIGLLLINFLDHPYRSDPGSIQPTQMTATLTMMRQQEPGLRVPCRGDGLPFLSDRARVASLARAGADCAGARAEPGRFPQISPRAARIDPTPASHDSLVPETTSPTG